MSESVLPSLGDGQRGGQAAWQSLVARVLRRDDALDRLTGRTADGISVHPLYCRDAAGEADDPLPGLPPFTRGARASGGVMRGWDVRQRHAHPDPRTTNLDILTDLERGATSAHLVLDDALAGGAARPRGVLVHTLFDLEEVLENVDLELAPVSLEAGVRFAEGAALLHALLQRRACDPDRIEAAFGMDPLGTVARGASLDPDAAVRRAVRLAVRLAGDWPKSRAMLADGRPYHEGGASEAQELAFAMATGLAYLRALEAEGLEPGAAAPQIGFLLAADDDFFLTIAKLRAARQLWARIVELAGGKEAARRMHLHAETARRMMARRDVWVNMLRCTIAGFAAGVGGADAVGVLPFDHELGLPDRFARRIARNTQLVLIEESNLHRVVDPAGGSWFVESMTADLAARAWELLQQIERAGGMAAALRAGLVQGMTAEAWTARRRAIATRRQGLTGLSEFPWLGEPPRKTDEPGVAAAVGHLVARLVRHGTSPHDTAKLLAAAAAGDILKGPEAASSGIRPVEAHSLGEDFERLRDRAERAAARGTRPRVFLACLGRLADANVRATWTANLVEAGGLEAVHSGSLPSAEEAARAFRDSGCKIAFLCSSDAVYERLAVPVAQALSAAGAACLGLAGRPGEAEAALREAGIDAFAWQGIDVVALLERLHDILKTPAAPTEERR
ncbi:methylmalonyl-CoA mutase family protein [Geminicoccaceae bacterium 1502E]|nr:methylmalonyl-CoA mutase family protein [Geminicoccaceae bacterium 1502E]